MFFLSTLLTIPWIKFGFKNPEKRLLGLRQTRKSLITLLVVESIFFCTLVLLLSKPNPDIAGEGDFGWMYLFVYEKGILPIIGLMQINDHFFRNIFNHTISFFIAALVMDYLILKFISPQFFKRRKASPIHNS